MRKLGLALVLSWHESKGAAWPLTSRKKLTNVEGHDMAKSVYKIVAIKPGMEQKYREFWIENKKVSEDGTKLHSAMLADTDMLEAKNMAEAERLAAKKYPGRALEVSRLGKC
ncbi:hypothetical protein ACI2UY_22260 [Ralstonia nicotianae]